MTAIGRAFAWLAAGWTEIPPKIRAWLRLVFLSALGGAGSLAWDWSHGQAVNLETAAKVVMAGVLMGLGVVPPQKVWDGKTERRGP